MLTKKEQKHIRIELLKLDISYAEIARKFHTSRQMVHQAVKGSRDSELAKQLRAHVYKLIGRQEEARLPEEK